MLWVIWIVIHLSDVFNSSVSTGGHLSVRRINMCQPVATHLDIIIPHRNPTFTLYGCMCKC